MHLVLMLVGLNLLAQLVYEFLLLLILLENILKLVQLMFLNFY